MRINFECKKCHQEFDCEMGQIGINEVTMRPDFEKPIVCPRCGERTMDEAFSPLSCPRPDGPRVRGLNPKQFGKLANQKQEPWKEPLSDFIESIYWKRFKKGRPDNVRSIELEFRYEDFSSAIVPKINKIFYPYIGIPELKTSSAVFQLTLVYNSNSCISGG